MIKRASFFILLVMITFSACAHASPPTSTPRAKPLPANTFMPTATFNNTPLPPATATIITIGTPTLILTSALTPTAPTPFKPIFSFEKYLSGDPTTLTASVESIDINTGQATINGGDSRQPSNKFTFEWGDGKTNLNWFPANHSYADTSKNYIVKITATYNQVTDWILVPVIFVQPAIRYVSLPDVVKVTIPDHNVILNTRLYPIGNLAYFDDSYFEKMSRQNIEYLLSLSASIQYELVKQNVFLVDGNFQQIVLRDPYTEGMYSLWFTNPVSFASGNYGFIGAPHYSSFFHEMGHNFTLNSPANYYYGGKIDGNANAIYSETMANIFAHTTAYEILNHFEEYGIDPILAAEIETSAVASMSVTRTGYENYIANGIQFNSWNNPNTTEDETFNTFMTLAYMFCIHAEQGGQGYHIPAKRMMEVLQLFNSDWLALYSPATNSANAESFRATLMVAAMSYGFNTDLREEFRNLNFPIDDFFYEQITATIASK